VPKIIYIVSQKTTRLWNG